MSNDPAQYRICVEKFTPAEQQKLESIRGGGHSPQRMQKLQAAFVSAKLWPAGSKIRIAFLPTQRVPPWTPENVLKQNGKPEDPLSDELRGRNLTPQEVVRRVVRDRIMPLVGLDIEFVENTGQANVRVAFNDNGAWSYVGTDHLKYKKTDEPTMNFAWIDVGTIIHEFGHMLGMIHEHQNPRGKTIDWDKQAVYAWAKQTQGWSEKTTEINIMDRYDINQLNGSDFDPLSIMLYFFPAKLTLDGEGTQQNMRLSGYDVLWINKMYRKNAKTTAEAFYPKVYGMTLQEAIESSDKAKKGGGGWIFQAIKLPSIGSGVWNTLLVILALVVLAAFLIWLFRRFTSGRSSGRSGRY